MREIPSLQVLCLRSVGSLGCSAERTFDPSKSRKKNKKRKQHEENELSQTRSSASKLLQSFDDDKQVVKVNRTPAIGKGSARRNQANDVDLNHPWIGTWFSGTSNENQMLQMEYGSPSLDVLQSFIDSLVELGRMDDSKLGVQFFKEWKANVQAKTNDDSSSSSPRKRKKLTPSKKRAKREGASSVDKLGSLSLHNATLGEDTVNAMIKSGMPVHLAVLDLTGIQPLTDDLLLPILQDAKNLKRLSVKNCRRLTNKTLENLGHHTTQLTSLDIGGAYNLKPQAVLEACANLFYLEELFASGLAWTDSLLQELTSLRGWKGLAVGFAPLLTAAGFKAAMLSQTKSLISLSIPFCEQMVDAALLGALGRHLPLLRALDVRGNSNLTSLTGWYDGRATLAPKPEAQPLLVLARYAGVTKTNLEDTKRIHPLDALQLECIFDSGGIGLGIQRRVVVPSTASSGDAGGNEEME